MIRGILALWLTLCLLAGVALGEVFLREPDQPGWDSRPLLRLTTFMTGQSDCMLLECGGQAMMIDGGKGHYREKLREALKAKGITHFKYLLNTHFHEDHLTGLLYLMRDGFGVDAFLTPYQDYAAEIDSLQREAITEAKKRNIPVVRIATGDELLLGEAVLSLYRYDEGLSTNGRSVVTRVAFGSCTLLLSADIIGDTQSRMLKEGLADWLSADVLKAPHHAITPMNRPFLNAVQPQAVIITNEIKRDHLGSVQLDAAGIPTLYTGEGTVILETDGEDIYLWQTPGNF